MKEVQKPIARIKRSYIRKNPTNKVKTPEQKFRLKMGKTKELAEMIIMLAKKLAA